MSLSLSLSTAESTVTSTTHLFSHPLVRAAVPHMDRRAHTDRRIPMKPMPVIERSWTRHVVVAGCLGALLGSTAAFGLLEQRQSAGSEPTRSAVNLEPLVPAAVAATAIMAPLFDTAPFTSGAALSTSLSNADPATGTASYSEDAAGVPSATYHEPPKNPRVSAAR